MNEKIKKHLQEVNKKEGIGIEDLEDDWVYSTLVELGNEVYTKVRDNRRWWDTVFVVVEIDGMLIGFESATTTGDASAVDTGWEFDEDSIYEVECRKETKVVTTYEKVE